MLRKFDIRTFVSFKPRIELGLATNLVLSGTVVSENSRSSYSRRVFELGKVVSLMTARHLENSSSLNCCNAVHYLTVFLSQPVLRSFDIRKIASSNLRLELALTANFVLSGRVVP